MATQRSPVSIIADFEYPFGSDDGYALYYLEWRGFIAG